MSQSNHSLEQHVSSETHNMKDALDVLDVQTADYKTKKAAYANPLATEIPSCGFFVWLLWGQW